MKLKVHIKKSRTGIKVKIEVAERREPYFVGEILMRGKFPNAYSANQTTDAALKAFAPCEVEYVERSVF
jgi:hypothetical protein